MCGVNDDADILEALFRRFVEAWVKPYYLHYFDLTRETNHFHVPIARKHALMRQLRGHVSGLYLPTYVLDMPDGLNKVPLDATYIHDQNGDSYTIETIENERVPYRK